MIRKLKMGTCLILVVLFLCSVCGCEALGNDVPTALEIQEIFDRDREPLLLIKDYLINTGYSELYIYDDCKTVRIGIDQKIQIDDDAVISALQQLRNSGYKSIAKDGNTIAFWVWSRLSDVGCGIAYSIDGKEISVEYLTESAPLSEGGWYYFVDDFNEWRSAGDGLSMSTGDGLREPG